MVIGLDLGGNPPGGETRGIEQQQAAGLVTTTGFSETR